MGAPTKFLFDLDFAASGAGNPSEREFAVRLAEAETAAHRRGFAEGQSETEAQSNRRTALALEQIAASLAVAARELHAIETRLECEAVEVAVAVAKKLAPALIEREPFAEISALAGECFRQLVTSPHVVVRLNDALYAAAKEKLDDIARGANYQGRLVVLAEPDIALGDCRIEWADGGINRDRNATDGAIGEAVGRYLRARTNLAAPAEVKRSTEDE